MEYVIRFAQAHESFRRPEIEALSRLAGLSCEIVSYKPKSPFCVVRFPDLDRAGHSAERVDEVVRAFFKRSVLAKSIYELWARGRDYDSLHETLRGRGDGFSERFRRSTFRFSVDCYGSTRSLAVQRELINGFKYLGLEGKIRMKDPEVEFTIMELWLAPGTTGQGPDGEGEVGDGMFDEIAGTKFREVFLGRKLGDSRRYLKDKHDLKKRPYISTTSMDAELALVTATLALASPGKLFMDPFVGTGGFMIAAAELGAMSFGSDIDGRSFKGKGIGIDTGVGANFKKYSLQHLFGDCVTSDLTNTPFRIVKGLNHLKDARWLDGIICDPPYGVREGLRVLGTRKGLMPPAECGGVNPSSTQGSTHQVHLIGGVPGYTLPGYIPPKKPYSFMRMLDDILDFAARTLVDGGRIAFWMPSANEDEFGQEVPTVIPSHTHLELKHECIQRFNKWSRRLLVYERLRGPIEIGEVMEKLSLDGTADELNPFRKRYFQPVVDRNGGPVA
ncbi:hypothetical protein LTR84_003055 [Exophiala bonariae]|uniref:tRNA (guanine(10)-N(2))-methyltransferase n=1 Tax=Exophiala bonariae TaxID=1690606 RepID=A0AAV9N8L3_9EURO|nr:hypothetical protein LTR84_003055 [Exophiala bonariae]